MEIRLLFLMRMMKTGAGLEWILINRSASIKLHTLPGMTEITFIPEINTSYFIMEKKDGFLWEKKSQRTII